MSFSTLPAGSSDTITPFQIQTPPEVLEELKLLVKYSRIAVPTYENTQKDGKYGIDREWMVNIQKKWLEFDWSKTECRLNSFPHFKASIEDDDGTFYTIHFAALFSKKADAVPLMMLHGWPGSFLEFMPILQLLKDRYTPKTLPYHIIVPSLPGYGYSAGQPFDKDIGIKDFGVEDAARLLDRLMSKLSFGNGYIVQGGDIGSRVGRLLAATYPGCKAVHVNMLVVPSPPPNTPLDDLTETEKQGLARGMESLHTGLAYALEHATKPSTIGLVLASNPMALMAWIAEKFHAWSDIPPSDETIIEFVTLYWITRTIERSLYPYRQDLPNGIGTILHAVNASSQSQQNGSVKPLSFPPEPQPAGPPKGAKPMGFSSFPKEPAPTPISWAKGQAEGNLDLLWWRVHETGGHFPALEQPEVLWEDVEEFVAQVWKGGCLGNGHA